MTDTLAMGRTIREARLAKGMSLGQLAAAVGRSSASVRRWERGEVAPAIGIIDELAQVLDLDADELRSHRPSSTEPAKGGDAAASSFSEVDRGTHDGPSTVEQDPVPASTPAADPPTTTAATSRGVVGDALAAMRAASSSWSGWIRAALTVVVLLMMVLILIWAVGQLAAGLSEIWDSFDTGSTN